MLGQYKKIAIMETTTKVVAMLVEKELKIPLDLNFIPNRILMHMWKNNSTTIGEDSYADTKFNTNISLGIYTGGYDYIYVGIKNFDKSNLILSIRSSIYMEYDISFEIIAME